MQLRASATDGRIQRALLIAVAVVCVISMGSSAAASESQVPTEGGVATLQDCFVQKKRLMAVVLVDESASLKGYGVRAATDPDNERVGALDSVLDTLSQLVTTGGTSLDVDVLVAGFGEEYLPATDWVTVNETDTPELAGVAEGFRDRNKAIDTDYVLALQGAQDALDQRAAATSAAGEACRLMVILSDGEYSLGTRTDRKPYAESVSLTSLKGQREAVQIGLKELCRPGGLADQLRSTETVTLGMGLQLKKDIHPDAELENVAPVDFFNALAMGQGGGFSCGNPDSGKFGAVVTADDFGEIVIKIFCMIQHCVLSDPLTVDRTVESIVVQTVLATPDGKLEVTDPTGRVEAVPLSKETSFSVLGGQARVRPQSAKLATLTIDFDQAGDAQVGQWTLAAAKDSGVGLVAAVNSNLSLELPDGQEWTIGQPGRVTGQFIVGDGLPITLAEVAGTVDVDGRVVVPGQSSEMSSTSAGPNADGTVELTVPAVPDLEQAAVTAEFTVTGAFPPVGTPPTEVLRPDGRATTSVLLRSEGFRVLDVPPGGLRLSGVSGGSDGEPIARGTLKALAGNEGGEICLKSVQMSEVPEDAVVDGLEPSTCSELTAGKPAEVDVGIVVDDVRSGEYDGFLQIELRSSSEEGVRRVQVPISFAGSEATCQAVAILILVGIVMGVMLLGLLVLYIVARRTGRLSSDLQTTVLFAAIPQELQLHGSVVEGLVSPVPADFSSYVKESLRKRDGVLAGERVNVVAKPRLFGLPQAQVRSDLGEVVGSHDGLVSRRGRRTSGCVPLELLGGWALVVTHAAPGEVEDDPIKVDGLLIAFAASGPGLEQPVEKLAAQLRHGLTTSRIKTAVSHLPPDQDTRSGIADRFKAAIDRSHTRGGGDDEPSQDLDLTPPPA